MKQYKIHYESISLGTKIYIVKGDNNKVIVKTIIPDSLILNAGIGGRKSLIVKTWDFEEVIFSINEEGIICYISGKMTSAWPNHDGYLKEEDALKRAEQLLKTIRETADKKIEDLKSRKEALKIEYKT